MSRKRTTYSADFLIESDCFATASLHKKAKVVLELLEEENTLNEIASKYNFVYPFANSNKLTNNTSCNRNLIEFTYKILVIIFIYAFYKLV